MADSRYMRMCSATRRASSTAPFSNTPSLALLDNIRMTDTFSRDCDIIEDVR